MTAAFALTIWVAASELASPSTSAAAQAASEVLGSDVAVRTATYPDGRPESVPGPTAGEASVELDWNSPQHETARLHLCRAAGDCFDRFLRFEPGDPEAERGRTVGLFVAGVLANQAGRPAPVPPPPPPSPPSTPPPKPRPARGELSAAVSLAGPGDATGVGARIGAGYVWSRSFTTEAALDARFGELHPAEATSRLASLTLNAVALPWRGGSRVWAIVSGGVGLFDLSISHFSSDDEAPVRKDRLLFGGSLAGGLGLDINDAASVCAEAGAEVLSGRTQVVVSMEPRASWPYATLVGRLGLRAFF